MYSTGRMLRALAVNSEAPKAFGRLNSRRTPAFGISVSVALMGIGVILNYLVPEKAFGYVTSVGTAARHLDLDDDPRQPHPLPPRRRSGWLPASAFPAPGGAVLSWVALAFLAFVTCLIAYDHEARVCLYVGALWAVGLVGGWQLLKRRTVTTGEEAGAYAPVE